MKPAEQLKAEHRVIARVIESLKNVADALEGERRIRGELLSDELDFIINFTDRCHHHKEETVLFPAIESRLITATFDPIPEMIAEHRLGRDVVKKIGRTIERYKTDPGVGPELAVLLRRYHDLLVAHIRKENTVLVDLIENQLPADKKLEVAERLEVVEDELGPDYHDRYANMAEQLLRRSKELAA